MFVLLAGAGGVLLAISFSFALLTLVLRLVHERRLQSTSRMHKRWEPAMLEVLGGAAPPEAIFDRVDDDDGLHFLRFLLGYARRLRGDERALVRVMAKRHLNLLLPKLSKGSPESRGNAVMMLAGLGMPTYADEVAATLSDESPIVSMIAARSLFRPGHERYFPAVLEHLPRFTTWSRSYLASMLSGGGPATRPHLRRILADAEERPLTRAVAADALRQLNDLESVPLAVELLESETDRELLAGCLRILKQLGHAAHIPAIVEMTASADHVVRTTAVSALGGLGGRSEWAVLQEKIDDPSYWVSLEAARGLLALGDSETLERMAAAGGPRSALANQVLSE